MLLAHCTFDMYVQRGAWRQARQSDRTTNTSSASASAPIHRTPKTSISKRSRTHKYLKKKPYSSIGSNASQSLDAQSSQSATKPVVATEQTLQQLKMQQLHMQQLQQMQQMQRAMDINLQQFATSEVMPNLLQSQPLPQQQPTPQTLPTQPQVLPQLQQAAQSQPLFQPQPYPQPQLYPQSQPQQQPSQPQFQSQAPNLQGVPAVVPVPPTSNTSVLETNMKNLDEIVAGLLNLQFQNMVDSTNGFTLPNNNNVSSASPAMAPTTNVTFQPQQTTQPPTVTSTVVSTVVSKHPSIKAALPASDTSFDSTRDTDTSIESEYDRKSSDKVNPIPEIDLLETDISSDMSSIFIDTSLLEAHQLAELGIAPRGV